MRVVGVEHAAQMLSKIVLNSKSEIHINCVTENLCMQNINIGEIDTWSQSYETQNTVK